jgi:hypothetical protein
MYAHLLILLFSDAVEIRLMDSRRAMVATVLRGWKFNAAYVCNV